MLVTRCLLLLAARWYWMLAAVVEHSVVFLIARGVLLKFHVLECLLKLSNQEPLLKCFAVFLALQRDYGLRFVDVFLIVTRKVLS